MFEAEDDDHLDDDFGGNASGSDFLEDEEPIDFYAILNVPREATPEEIHRAYKQRCLLFHPDRHLDEQDRKEAARIFVDLRKAYETLSDARMRQIYDVLGVRGIKTQGWQLVDLSTTPENIRREYEFLSRLRETEVMLQRVHPNCNFLTRISLIGCLLQEKEYRYGPEFLGMSMSQSVDCALVGSHKFGLAGRVEFNGRGGGNGVLQTSHKWAFSSQIQQETFFVASPGLLDLSTRLSLSRLKPGSFFNQYSMVLEPHLQYSARTSSILPSLTAMLIAPLGPGWQGIIALSSTQSLTISLVHTQLSRQKFVVNFKLAAIEPNLRLLYYFNWGDTHWTLQGNFGLGRIAPSVSCERRLTKYSRIALKMQFAYPAFLLQTSVKIQTGLSRYEFCFVLCDDQEEVANAFVYGVFWPSMAFLGARLLSRRFSIYKRFMRIFEDRTGDELLNQTRKEEAERVVHLLRDAAERIQREEQAKKGLVIVEAQYGQMVADVPGAESYPLMAGCNEELVIDVTIPLQALVNDSQLRIYTGKSQIPGFYDPCPGEPKCLRVVYRFHDRPHAVTVAEEQPLMLPVRAHRIRASSSSADDDDKENEH